MTIDEIVVTRSREDDIFKELDQIHSNRGKRSINHNEQMKSLNSLRKEVEQSNLNHSILIEIFLTQIILYLDQQNFQRYEKSLLQSDLFFSLVHSIISKN